MPKHIQQTIAWIFTALAFAAFLFFAHRVYSGSSIVKDIAGLMVTFVACIQIFVLCWMEDIFSTLQGRLTKIEAYQAAVSSASASVSSCVSYAGIESQASPVESRSERLHRDYEQILVHGAAVTIANQPGRAREIALGINAFLAWLESGEQKVDPKTFASRAAQQPAAAATQGDTTQTKGITFGLAIAALKEGKRVARAGWNGKGMWLGYTPGSEFAPEYAKPGHAAAHRAAEAPTEPVRLLPHIDMRAVDGSMVIGWLASQTDMLAEDWEVLG